MTSRYLSAGIAVVLITAAGWFFVSPLFIDKVVDEPFSEVPTFEALRGMPASERESLMHKLMEQAAAADTSVSESMDMADSPPLIATGQFSDADAVHRGSGRADVYELDDGSHLIRFEDFRVTNGPALVVLLARSPKPQNAKEVMRGYVKIGELKGNVGNQNYIVSSEVDIYRLGSVVIWCELFNVLFSAAPMNLL